MCICTDEVWIGQPDSRRTVDVEGGSCVDDTGCSKVVLSVRHITRSTYRNERAVKNGASVTVHCGMWSEGL